MRRTKLFVGTLLAAGFVVAFAASKKDPVLMKVDGKPVTLSEFVPQKQSAASGATTVGEISRYVCHL